MGHRSVSRVSVLSHEPNLFVDWVAQLDDVVHRSAHFVEGVGPQSQLISVPSRHLYIFNLNLLFIEKLLHTVCDFLSDLLFGELLDLVDALSSQEEAKNVLVFGRNHHGDWKFIGICIFGDEV